MIHFNFIDFNFILLYIYIIIIIIIYLFSRVTGRKPNKSFFAEERVNYDRL